MDARMYSSAMTGKPVRRADVIPLHVLADDRTHLRRAMMPERTVEEVLGEGNYVQIEEGLTDVMAHDEARRCLRCDICIGCGLCMVSCSEMGIEALRMADTPAGRLAYFEVRGLRNTVSAAAPAPKSVPPALSILRIKTGYGAQSSPAQW